MKKWKINKMSSTNISIFSDIVLAIIVLADYAYSLHKGRIVEFFMFITTMFFIRLISRDIDYKIKNKPQSFSITIEEREKYGR